MTDEDRMILWILLAGLVVVLSFVLAIKSMRDFAEISGSGGSLFLIRQSKQLPSQLNKIYDDLARSNLSLSFERLFKGDQSALAVFGPAEILTKYKNSLDLLELEDYTNIDKEISAWEVGVKNNGQLTTGPRRGDGQKIFGNLPKFADTEQFWWQVIVWVDKGQLNSKFQCQIRAILLSSDSERRKQLSQTLQNLASDQLFKIPKAFSNAQLLDFYNARSYESLRASLTDKKRRDVIASDYKQLLHLISI